MRWKDYLEASFVGASRGVIGLVIEHPFDSVKTRLQANSELSSVVHAMKDIWTNKGWKGFYAGYTANSIRAGLKQTYRWPLMFALPPFYKEAIPIPSSEKLLTGLTIANIEVFVISPLERIKVHVMTSNEKKGIRALFKANQHYRIADLYRGLRASYARQNVSWISFLMADDQCKKITRSFTKKKDLSYSNLLAIGVTVGIVNTAATLPFDYIKTLFQKQNPLHHKEKVFKTLVQIIQNQGIKTVYTGWKPKIIQYILQSTLTVSLMDKFEQAFMNQK